jgi:hypothetical protein
LSARAGRQALGAVWQLKLVRGLLLELATPCLQIAVISRVTGPEQGDRPPVIDRGVPLMTAVNGTLMAR